MSFSVSGPSMGPHLSQKKERPIPNIARSQVTTNFNIASLFEPFSILAGAIAGAKIGLNLCTIWCPGAPIGVTKFCLFYVIPHCAFIGASVVFLGFAVVKLSIAS